METTRWNERKEMIDELLDKIPKSDFYIDWNKYAIERLKWEKSDGSITTDYDVKTAFNKLIVHNGKTTKNIEKDYPSSEQVKLVLGREKAFLDEKNGILHISQISSISRSRRFEDMIYTGCVLNPNWNLEFESRSFENKQHTQRLYEKNAYDFVKNKLSIPNDKLTDIDFVSIGPLNWLRKHGNGNMKGAFSMNNEYLDFMVSDIEGKKVLSLDYIYSDQMKIIVDELLKTYSGETSDNKKRNIHILMYGKVGGINNDQWVNQIVMPNGIVSVDEYSLEPEYLGFTKIKNVLGVDDENNFILNSASVPLQRVSFLEYGRTRGCSVVEMEALHATNVINMARMQYHELNINQGFVGFISDTPLDPLNPSTLAENPHQEIGREKVIKTVLNYIKSI